MVYKKAPLLLALKLAMTQTKPDTNKDPETPKP